MKALLDFFKQLNTSAVLKLLRRSLQHLHLTLHNEVRGIQTGEASRCLPECLSRIYKCISHLNSLFPPFLSALSASGHKSKVT